VVRRDLVAAKAMLDYDRVHHEAETGVPALREFLLAVTRAADA
jgi:hypothetical protein